MMFTSRARALSEMGLALWEMHQAPTHWEPKTLDECQAFSLIQRVVMNDKADDWRELEKWLKESAEGRGSFI